jgi:hypothetical protein
MTEDLDQFFDTTEAGHAVSVTFKTGAGVTIRTASATFTDPLGQIDVGEADAEQAHPFISCKNADLAGVDHSSKVTIGANTYRIIRKAGDGAVAIVLLQKV